MKKALSITLAALTAASTCVCAYADNDLTAENKTVLSMVKSRVDVPEELTEFTFSKFVNGPVNCYNYTWTTPFSADEYSSMSVTAYANIITSYAVDNKDVWNYDSNGSLAKMSGDQLYAAAVAKIKQLNPTVYKTIKVDRDSIRMNIHRNTATFSVYRTKNGVPVKSDRGSITLDKNTGEVYSFSINWHPKAAFRKLSGVISTEEAEKAYADMIAIKPVYVLNYDYETKTYSTNIEYRQTDYGEINAFTGNKSDFEADMYYDDDDIFDETGESATDTNGANPDTGFTPKELEELEKELPFGNAEAVIELVKSNKYLTWNDTLTVSNDYLYKTETASDVRYIYSVQFDNNGEFSSSSKSIYMSVNLDAETGELISYYYGDYNGGQYTQSYDADKAEKLAEKILKEFSPSHYSEYGSPETNVNEYNHKYYGSDHSFTRVVNGIDTEFDHAEIIFDKDMRLTNYSINYTNVDFVSPDTMLSADQIMEKFYENSPLELNYLVKTGKTKTASVLVYSDDDYLRYDAFTGEPVYVWNSKLTSAGLDGITDKALLKKAEVLTDNGLVISTEEFTQNDTVSRLDFERMTGYIAGGGWYSYGAKLDMLPSGISNEKADPDTKLTRADAMCLFTSLMAGDNIAQLKGIFKSPFTDVPDDDPYTGYYAIAYALGAANGTTLAPTTPYTYADLINLVYDYLTKQ
ncbi:MAG: YcdB/YcdC domain-containing protein [Oscillospiraceae bacterium]